MVIGYLLGYWKRSHQWSKVIAMQRTLFRHGAYSNPLPAMACVNIEKSSNGYLVVAETAMTYPRFGTGYRTHHVGTAATEADAIGKWAFVNWTGDGLHLGRETNEFVIGKDELESGGR
jgi:hypothetical protein